MTNFVEFARFFFLSVHFPHALLLQIFNEIPAQLLVRSPDIMGVGRSIPMPDIYGDIMLQLV